MKKIFLSLGFKGRSEEDIMKDINKAKEAITSIYKNEEIEFIHNYNYLGHNRMECLGEAIKKMSMCNEVYFINDWYNYNGCVMENKICELYDLPYDILKV